MDRQLLARLIGAGVLVVALVIVAPAILDGDSGGEPAVTASEKEPRRTHTIRLDQSTKTPPVAREVAKSEPVRSAAESSAESTRPAKVVSSSTEPAAATPVSPKPKPQKPVLTSESGATKPQKAPVTSAPPRVPSAPVPKSGWVVQLGSFSSKQNAQRLATEVNGRGFSAFLMPLDRRGKQMYRVRVGPRETRAQAAELAGRLAKVGYTGQVTRQQPDA